MESRNKLEQPELVMRNQQEDEIDLVELFYLLWGHMLQIIACVIVGGAAAFAYTYFMVMPMYQATAKMYVASCPGRGPPTPARPTAPIRAETSSADAADSSRRWPRAQLRTASTARAAA